MITADEALMIAHGAAAAAFDMLSQSDKRVARSTWIGAMNGKGPALIAELGAFVTAWPDAPPEAVLRTLARLRGQEFASWEATPAPVRVAATVFRATLVPLAAEAAAAAKAKAERDRPAAPPARAVPVRDTIFHQPSILDREW